MIPSLHISKEEPGLYRARLVDWDAGEVEFEGPSISHLIRTMAAGAPLASAIQVWYEHISIGTTSVQAMRHDAETLAQRLMVLHGQFR